MGSRHSNGRHRFIDDWPAHDTGSPPVGRKDGVGPIYTDEKCESCGALVQASGECRCSA